MVLSLDYLFICDGENIPEVETLLNKAIHRMARGYWTIKYINPSLSNIYVKKIATEIILVKNPTNATNIALQNFLCQESF